MRFFWITKIGDLRILVFLPEREQCFIGCQIVRAGSNMFVSGSSPSVAHEPLIVSIACSTSLILTNVPTIFFVSFCLRFDNSGLVPLLDETEIPDAGPVSLLKQLPCRGMSQVGVGKSFNIPITQISLHSSSAHFQDKSQRKVAVRPREFARNRFQGDASGYIKVKQFQPRRRCNTNCKSRK